MKRPARKDTMNRREINSYVKRTQQFSLSNAS